MKGTFLTIFATGALCGSFFTWYVIKDKYEKIAQEEIESVKNAFSKISSQSIEDQKEAPIEESVKQDYFSIANNYITPNDAKEEECEDYMNKPYVIAPEEFDELEDYESVSLSYYSDGVLADTITNELVEDVKETVGDFKSHFGEYEDDSVFIRNDKLRCDYEILKDERTYEEIVNCIY